MEHSGRIPGLMSLEGATTGQHLDRVILVVDKYWETLATAINHSSSRMKSSLFLLVAFRNQCPYRFFEADLGWKRISAEVLIKCRVLYIEGDKLGSYYSQVFLDGLQKKIVYDKPYNGGSSDEATCIAFCYECEMVNNLCALHLKVQGFLPSTDAPYDLNLALRFSSYKRFVYDPTNMVVDEHVLYMCSKGTHAIDYLAVTKFGTKSYLIIIQLSIRKARNIAKMANSIITIPGYMFEIHSADVDPPNEVLYVYVNPNVEFEFSEGLQTAINIVSKANCRIRSLNKRFHFAMPSSECQLRSQLCLQSLKESMDPSILML